MGLFHRVFLVDDDITNFLNEHLIQDSRLAQHIEIFSEAKQALEFVKTECPQRRCPNLILLDLNMPSFTGFDFIEAFQRLHTDKIDNVKIVVLTSSQNHQDLQRLKTLGIKDILNKPLTKEKMLSVI